MSAELWPLFQNTGKIRKNEHLDFMSGRRQTFYYLKVIDITLENLDYRIIWLPESTFLWNFWKYWFFTNKIVTSTAPKFTNFSIAFFLYFWKFWPVSKLISNIAQNALQRDWGFASFANGSCSNEICCTIYKITFSFPFGIFYVQKEIWKQVFQKRPYITL